MEWQYPKLATLRIENNLNADGYLIVNGSSDTPVDQKTLSFKGFKVPASGEDAEASTSSLQTFCNVILGIFNLGDHLISSGATAQITAEVTES